MGTLRNVGLVPKFAVVSLVLMLALGIVVAGQIETDVETRHLDGARDAAALIAQLGVRSQLTPSMTGAALSEWFRTSGRVIASADTIYRDARPLATT